MGIVRSTCRSLLRRTARIVDRLSPGAVDTAAIALRRRMAGQTSDLLLFDRPGDVLLLCSKGADVEPILGPGGY